MNPEFLTTEIVSEAVPLPIAKQNAVLEISHHLLWGIRCHLDQNSFFDATPSMPALTRATGSCENLDTTFRLKFFGEKAYLAQTKQLYLETMVPKHKKVCCEGLSSRAEPKADSRHLSEFYLIQYEFAKAGDEDLFEKLLASVENVIHASIDRVITRARDQLERLGVDLIMLQRGLKPFERVTYDDAIEICGLEWGSDLKREHEAILVERSGNRPLYVTYFPKKIKFFNMRDNDKNPDLVNSADLIMPYSGEAVGAAEREYDYDKIRGKLLHSRMFAQLQRKGGTIADFEYFLENLRRNGSVPHAGCGIGFNRLVQYVCQLPDIRMTTMFPVYRGSIY